MPDFDAYKHFEPQQNAKEDFSKSNDWIVQQKKKLNEKQKAQFERLQKEQYNEIELLKKRLERKGFERKRHQPKPRLVPDSHRVRTSKKKIEVIRPEKPSPTIADVKIKHAEQTSEFFKTAEAERESQKSVSTILDKATSKAFKSVVRERTGKGKDRGDGR